MSDSSLERKEDGSVVRVEHVRQETVVDRPALEAEVAAARTAEAEAEQLVKSLGDQLVVANDELEAKEGVRVAREAELAQFDEVASFREEGAEPEASEPVDGAEGSAVDEVATDPEAKEPDPGY